MNKLSRPKDKYYMYINLDVELLVFNGANIVQGEGRTSQERTNQGANEPESEQARGRTSKGAKKPDTSIRYVNYYAECVAFAF